MRACEKARGTKQFTYGQEVLQRLPHFFERFCTNYGSFDIGLETIRGTLVLETTCEESPLQEKSLDPKVAPIVVDSDLQAVIDVWPKLCDAGR